jgi:hypothetical protein
VAVLDPRTGSLVSAKGFDTAANEYEAVRLATFLAATEPGQIVVLATKGDATAYLTPDLVGALRELGSRVNSVSDLDGRAHVLVGVQGASPGTAAEAIAPGDAYLRIWSDFRRLSAAVDWVELGDEPAD